MMNTAQQDTKTLEEKCRAVLHKNWRDGFTVPTPELYPFQWLWDSGFIAIGWSHSDMDRARQEVQTVINAQWKNGFLPHIIFHNDTPEKNYFPGADFHGAAGLPDAPDHVKTSGITQPAVLGFVLEYLWRHESDPDNQRAFYTESIASIFRFHQHLYHTRDPQNEGLVYIRHNWESGTDNARPWDAIWQTYTVPDYDLTRKDTHVVEAAQRPTKQDYNYYIHLLKVSIEQQYNEKTLAETIPFLVQDPLFNSMLVASNESLIRLAEALNLPAVAEQCQEWNERTIAAMNQKLWHEALGQYVYYDLRNEQLLPIPGSPGMTPLFAGVPSPERAARMIQELTGPGYTGPNQEAFLAATLPLTHPDFTDRRYWRGPVWININWLLHAGCRRYGFSEMADQLRADSLELVSRYGCYEYFSPLRAATDDPASTGYGAPDFSWSAALIIDFLNQPTT